MGDSYDNALAETINGLFKAEVTRRAKTLPVNKHWADVEHNAKEI